MGTFELNDYENLGMMLHSIESSSFEMTLKVNMTFEGDNVFEQKLMVESTRYHSNFTIQPQYLNWERLNWKFMCLSMGSLQTSAIGVMLMAASLTNKMK